jgi:inner membrane transporter RhtA
VRNDTRLADRLPPQSYFAVSAVFHYLGPSLAVLLFTRVSVLGVAWLRIVTAALVFAAWRRPWRMVRRLDRRQRWVLVALGVVLATMNCLFYLAVDRLPLSTVGAIEFLGTVLLAALGVRTRRNALALLLTTAGVAAITELRLGGQPLGFVFAFGNCVLFMLYVVLGHRIANTGGPTAAKSGSGRTAAMSGSGRAAAASGGGAELRCSGGAAAGSGRGAAAGISNIDQLGASMLLAAVAVTPFTLGSALPAFSQPTLLLAGAGVGICSSVIPYITDQLAMARLPRATFALMLALLPMFAMIIGAIVLHQIPTVQDLVGIALVVAGVAVHQAERATRPHRPDAPARSASANRADATARTAPDRRTGGQAECVRAPRPVPPASPMPPASPQGCPTGESARARGSGSHGRPHPAAASGRAPRS